jgi:hypothetical protein
MTKTQKTTIYLDPDDDITSVIDKMNDSPSKIVALVLPKRTQVMQSSVNMKLLKRAASVSKKQPVLVTTDKSLELMAADVGIYIAESLQAKPYLPSASSEISLPHDAMVGDLVSAEVESPAPVEDISQNAEPQREPQSPEAIDEEDIAVATMPKDTSELELTPAEIDKKDKKLRVPDFYNFRNKMFILLAILGGLGYGGWYAVTKLPKVTVVLKAVTQKVPQVISVQANDAASATLVVQKSIKEVVQEKAAATGTKDLGEKAKGQVTIKNCNADGSALSIPAGTGVSVGDKTYITQGALAIEKAYKSGADCIAIASGTTGLPASVGAVSVIAQENGEGYNLSVTSGQVAGVATATVLSLNATGGSSRVAKIATAGDIAAVKAKVAAKAKAGAKELLTKQLSDENRYVISATYLDVSTAVTTSPAADQEAAEVSASATFEYVMYGVAKDVLQAKMTEQLKSRPELVGQRVLQPSQGEPQISVVTPSATKPFAVKIESIAVVGPDIKLDEAKTKIIGKKKSEILDYFRAIKGVQEVDVSFAPFFVSKAPSDTSRSSVTIDGL